MFSIIALILAIYLYCSVKRQNIGNERMAFLADAIQSGAMAFLKREYIFLFGFVVFFWGYFFLITLL